MDTPSTVKTALKLLWVSVWLPALASAPLFLEGELDRAQAVVVTVAILLGFGALALLVFLTAKRKRWARDALLVLNVCFVLLALFWTDYSGPWSVTDAALSVVEVMSYIAAFAGLYMLYTAGAKWFSEAT
jgi:hypothetical protein